MKPTVKGRIKSLVFHLATTSEQIGKFKAKDEAAGKIASDLVEKLQKAREDIYKQIENELTMLIPEDK